MPDQPETTIRPDAELYVLLRKAGVDRHDAQALIDAHAAHARTVAAASGVQPDTGPAMCACDGQTLLQVHAPGGCYDVAPARPVPDTERRAGYAETLAIADGWEWGPGLSSVPSGIIERYLKAADAALAVADEEQRDLRADRDNLRVMYDVSEARVHDLIEERDRLQTRLQLVTAETVADVVGPNIDLLCKENARLRAERDHLAAAASPADVAVRAIQLMQEADAERARLRAEMGQARAATLLEAADFVRGLLLTRTGITTAGLEAELRTMAAAARSGGQAEDGAQQPRCPAKHGALGRICELPAGHAGSHSGDTSNGGAVWDGGAP
jgi:hypothetical protein